MLKRFRYPEGLSDELSATLRTRGTFWSALCFTMFGVGLWRLIGYGQWEWMAAGIILPFLCALFEVKLSRFARKTLGLLGQQLILENNRLRQFSITGKLLAEVDLLQPYRVRYLYKTGRKAILHIMGTGGSLVFSSKIQAFEELLKEIVLHKDGAYGSLARAARHALLVSVTSAY